MLVVIFTLIAAMLAGDAHHNSVPVIRKVEISKESKMFLAGFTNVNLYNCDCQNELSQISMTIANEGNHATYQNAILKLKPTNFDCHNSIYNINIKRSLEAGKYPSITIALIETWQDAQLLDGSTHGWFNIISKINLTIKETSKTETVKAKAQYLGGNKLRIVGARQINMSDFGIEVPKFMCGLVKVGDQIDFNFDLVVELM
jgi:hypothetical protein